MKRNHIRATVAVLCLAVLFSGCYTRITVVQRSPKPSDVHCPDSLDGACIEVDSPDTVVIRDERRQTCYWTRNFWGEPTLRCYRTYYHDDWVSYYSDPWWYNRYDYSYGYRHCPAHYYFDPYTGYCRHYRDYSTYYYPSRPSSGTTSGGSSSPSAPRHSSDTRIDAGAPQSAPAPLPKESERGELPAYLPGGSSRAGSSVQPSTAPAAPAASPAASGVAGPAPSSQLRKAPARSAPPRTAPAPTEQVQDTKPYTPAPGGTVGQTAPASGSAASETDARRRSQEERKAGRLSGEQ